MDIPTDEKVIEFIETAFPTFATNKETMKVIEKSRYGSNIRVVVTSKGDPMALTNEKHVFIADMDCVDHVIDVDAYKFAGSVSVKADF